ncbi:hypothetical protein BGW36DRAFT_329153 [Talaromyces proteolyticus]|uniref:BZIP domain-containing protein n=1 Tax=Talaromyces proteolyticus TaxID=1131652 RepID=A0AAD4KJ90_9EURO|nr:uncharacterized protein BGW36DRAFT_329153 [Talaromyces proteolyticus]KAH8689821.1 hypothetical protein BGW36DRAFT_329153 [Talaromyces proteolyticus]
MDNLLDSSLDAPQLTISPADTSLSSPTPEVKAEFEIDVDVDVDVEEEEEEKTEEKKPVKKRKSWGQELPTPKTNLPPRKRAKTEDEKEQRRIERVLRNRAAAQTSRERKRLEVEKLEGEKKRMEQQNQFLLQRLTQMEVENNRLNRQVAQLSAEIRGSRGTTPKSVVSDLESPTLTPTLFKQERDELLMDKIPFPSPSLTDYSPSLKPADLAEASDLTQHPAAVLCDLQCQSKASKEQTEHESYLTPNQNWITLPMTWQLLCLTMTSAAYSTVILPLLQILNSMKAGSPLTFSTEETYRLLPLIHWLISTPSLSPSMAASTRRSVFRKRVLSRLLACSPALARPLRDATGKALQLAVNAASLRQTGSAVDDVVVGGPTWESLMTMAWAIDSIRRKSSKKARKTRMKRQMKASHGSMRSLWRSADCIVSGKVQRDNTHCKLN